jgi:hypothetical protein
LCQAEIGQESSLPKDNFPHLSQKPDLVLVVDLYLKFRPDGTQIVRGLLPAI